MTAIDIRPFDQQFADAVGPFVLGIEHEFGIDITLDNQPDLSAIEHYYLKPGGNFWLAVKDGEIVGTIAIINAGNGIGIIRKMFVAPPFRGAPHQLGQHLLDTMIPWARAHGFKKLYLGTIDILQRALRFYEKNGFTRFPEERLPQEVNRIKMSEDNVYYTKDLAA